MDRPPTRAYDNMTAQGEQLENERVDMRPLFVYACLRRELCFDAA